MQFKTETDNNKKNAALRPRDYLNNINVHIMLLLDSCRSVAFINSEIIILSSNVPLGVLGYKIVYKTKRRLDFS